MFIFTTQTFYHKFAFCACVLHCAGDPLPHVLVLTFVHLYKLTLPQSSNYEYHPNPSRGPTVFLYDVIRPPSWILSQDFSWLLHEDCPWRAINTTNINDFKALPHAFPSRWFNPSFACPWRAENVPSNFEFISYRNNLRRKLSTYLNKTRPLLNSYSKRRLAAMF